MTQLVEEIESFQIPEKTVRLWWLGQAGFVFKTHSGKIIYVDPYLSDAVERLHGFKRLSLTPITPEEVKADLVISSHEHTDHLDPDTLPVVARNNPSCIFAGSRGCQEFYPEFGIEDNWRVILEPNTTCDLSGVKIFTVSAEHGDYAPTAVTFLLDFDGLRVLYSGDTSLQPDRFKPLYDLKPDILTPCINGNFGNMNHIDAARMAQQASPRIAIPAHFRMFVEHGGDPAGFLYACKHFCPEVSVVILKPGEGLFYNPNSKGTDI